MQATVQSATAPLPAALLGLLPPRLIAELEALEAPQRIEELRLRRGRCASLTRGGCNLRLRSVLSPREMDALLPLFCEGSVYAHAEELCRGYIRFAGGIRIGVAGHATLRDDRVLGVSDIEGYVIRLPHEPPQTGAEIASLLRQSTGGGTLLYAPPGVGKTTLLRAVSGELAGGEHPLRVVLVDTRGELALPSSRATLLLDVLAGYPRGIGISIATRTLSAEVIVCDEIGDLTEAQEILHAHAAGVPLLASAHASELAELLARPGIRALHDARCFANYVGVSRGDAPFTYRYRITAREDADAFL